MKFLSSLFILFSSIAFAESPGDILYKQSFVSANKGDCTIENANNFAPAIQSFKILVGTQTLQNNSGNAFLYYNMLGTSAGIMTPAQYMSDKVTGAQTITGQILLGLTDVAELQLKPSFNLTTGSITITKSGPSVFTSTFICK